MWAWLAAAGASLAAGASVALGLWMLGRDGMKGLSPAEVARLRTLPGYREKTDNTRTWPSLGAFALDLRGYLLELSTPGACMAIAHAIMQGKFFPPVNRPVYHFNLWGFRATPLAIKNGKPFFLTTSHDGAWYAWRAYGSMSEAVAGYRARLIQLGAWQYMKTVGLFTEESCKRWAELMAKYFGVPVLEAPTSTRVANKARDCYREGLPVWEVLR